VIGRIKQDFEEYIRPSPKTGLKTEKREKPMTGPDSFPMEFHVSRQARDRYQFDEALFASSGNVIFANFHASRLFAQKINAQRDMVSFPEQAVRAGQINAMGLIDEILHMVVSVYRKERSPDVMGQALDYLYDQLGAEQVDQAIHRFSDEFPPLEVYRREVSLEDYLEGSSPQETGPKGRVPNRQIVLEEMLLLWLANANQAFSPFLELFEDDALEKESAYLEIISHLHDFFDQQPVFGPDGQNLVDMLRSPAIAVPHSLSGQLEYIRQRWYGILGRHLYRLLSSLDLIREEEKASFLGPGPARVYEFGGLELEAERFSMDKDWMPSLVLIAKNSYVWLDQLSKTYRRSITRLNQVPDEELDRLAGWGITGLWLIGLWERSKASQRIKQMRGNPEAVASAYSLFEYTIAEDLGGEEAFHQLRDRAWQRGIRLASDMVPNHMGIDSRWVIEHPDWFISLDYSPFPSYTFNGPDLSWDTRAGIYIEDHYFDNTDAAVVFKRVEHASGETRFIYHGNDGTSMPWNDTAQLNYLIPEVREAVIQTILDVARRFSIIRFDAAMTLAKKHYQRLWFPEPGTGGAIPSRAEQGLTKEQFDALMPQEFWREVVDRVAQEAPDTLLLAEAFWLMEGYFVRTLGMHRVYNSAFMNMLRDEKNAEYRLVIKNTLEFDPEILKRYVNFMNNPDERTAIDQFGSGDKYFGICTLMATMPGLPMLGHGQVEGFSEKYGMEYRRAYWAEEPNQWLVERHEREIFPLQRKRAIFAEVRDFLLYDFFTPEGHVSEDVFAYSNRAGDERSLVVYHNKFATTRGWIRSSAAFSVKSESGERRLVQKTLADGLGLQNDLNTYCIFRDEISRLEFIRSSRELHEKGLYIELAAYKCHVFTGFREVQDDEWGQYANLVSYLEGRGVPRIDEVLKEIFLQPIHRPFRELVNQGFLRWVIDNLPDPKSTREVEKEAVLDEAEQKMTALLSEVRKLIDGTGSERQTAARVRRELEAAMGLQDLKKETHLPDSKELRGAGKMLKARKSDLPAWGRLLAWLFTHRLDEMLAGEGDREAARSWIDEWLLGKLITSALVELGLDERAAWRAVTMVKLLTGHEGWWELDSEPENLPYLVLQRWLRDGEVQQYLGVNRYQGVLWYNKESFDDLLWWQFKAAAVVILAETASLPEAEAKTAGEKAARRITNCFKIIQRLQEAEAASGFQLERLLEEARELEA
jgi:glycosidase